MKLSGNTDFPHEPDLIGICILDLDKDGKPWFVNLNDFDFSDETKKLLKNEFSPDNFIDKFIHLANSHSLK